MLAHIKRAILLITYKIQGKQNVHFLHIGKTGGSAIQYVLNQYPLTSRYVIYRHGHDIKLKDIPNGDKVFFALRDPLTRFVSGFYSRKRQGQPKKFIPWSLGEKKAFEDFSSPNQLAEALSSLDTEERKKAHKAMANIGHVNSSYWDWFLSEEYFRSRSSDIFFICFQEQLSEDFEILKLKLDLPLRAILPSDDVIAHRNPTEVDKKLTDESIKNLTKWYEKDFAFLAVCQDIIREYPEVRNKVTT